jgi:hypothetical protein
LTEEALAPLSAEELADDLAKSPQAEPRGIPEADDWHRPGDEHVGDVDDAQPGFSEAIVTRLPPG